VQVISLLLLLSCCCARILGALNDQERKNVVIHMISRFHPEIADEGIVDDHASMFWDSYRWSGGSFSFLQPRHQTTLYKYAIQHEGNIHFAGEHCSLYNAWIQGALVSAFCRIFTFGNRFNRSLFTQLFIHIN
jgi:monoamine oxidase